MKFLKNEEGAAAVEYAMIIGVIALSSYLFWKILGFTLRFVVMRLLYNLLW
ncbi:MAG: Flp family type IVb pilin [Candidatus Hydrothermales bacterium]